MQIIMTLGEIKDRVDWIKVCELKGWSEWILNEGLVDATDTITLTEAEAYQLGIKIRKLDSSLVKIKNLNLETGTAIFS